MLAATALVMVVMLSGSGCHLGRSDAGSSTGAGAGAHTTEESLTVDGQRRTFRVHTPPDSAPEHTGSTTAAGLPVVIGLHGGGGNGEQFERQSGLSAVADRSGFIAVYPNGTGRTQLLTWNAGACCGYARDHEVNDVRFIASMLDRLVGKYHTDPQRVYVTGLSNGAMMAYRLGCELADRIAAIAPVAGALNVDGCRPSRPLAVLAVHGTADQLVPYRGGPPARSVPGSDTWQNRSVAESVGFWVDQDRCPTAPTESRDGAVVRASHAPCAGGLEVVLYSIDGGGHAWPGGVKARQAADEPPPKPDASTLMLEFFTRYRVGG